ncbi:hypothetical protein [Isoptericola aurantiacus]|uniref:hypothetical protein n=1 Tax=Isoptericola aurantiacus TaxID=3377839 RepID=UPI00383A1E0E
MTIDLDAIRRRATQTRPGPDGVRPVRPGLPRAAYEDREALIEEVERLRGIEGAIRADIEQIRREASEEAYREPDHLDELLGIDPNDDATRLAARAVEYRRQRGDLARLLAEAKHDLRRARYSHNLTRDRAEDAEAAIEQVRALADSPVEIKVHTGGGNLVTQKWVVWPGAIHAALDAHTARGDAHSAPEGDGATEGAGGRERGRERVTLTSSAGVTVRGSRWLEAPIDFPPLIEVDGEAAIDGPTRGLKRAYQEVWEQRGWTVSGEQP